MLDMNDTSNLFITTPAPQNYQNFRSGVNLWNILTEQWMNQIVPDLLSNHG